MMDTRRTFEAFQFDLENARTMPQLIGRPTEERNTTTWMLNILTRTLGQTAAEVAPVSAPYAAQEGGLNVLCVKCLQETHPDKRKRSWRQEQEEQCVGLGHAETKGWAPTRVRIAATGVTIQLADRETF